MKRIPKSITVITGGQHEVAKTIDDFFLSTRDFLIKKDGANPRYFEIRLEGTYQKPPGVFDHNLTDNNVHMLLYKEKVIATVIETRTSFNNVHYDFFRNLKNII